jgi:uncharacterized protein
MYLFRLSFLSSSLLLSSLFEIPRDCDVENPNIQVCFSKTEKKMKSPTTLRMVRSEEFSVQVSSKVTIACNLWYAAKPQNQQQQQAAVSNNNNNNFGKTTVVFCHQFGKMGGSAQLLIHMARLVVAQSIEKQQQNNNPWSAVTFDFRGVGNSTGSSTWTCSDEVEDVEALCKFLVKSKGVEKIFIVGSSAGASVAGSALDSCPQIAAGCFIAYTYGYLSSILFSGHYQKFINSVKPKLMFHATLDGFTSMSQFEDLFNKLKGNQNEKVIVEEVGHFEVEQPAFDLFMAQHIYDFCSKF